MKRLFYGCFLIVIAGCAMTYERPTATAPDVSAPLKTTRQVALSAAKRALISEGMQISSSDHAAGIISTAMRNMKLTPAQADCGKTMGIDYLKDSRTSTRVGYNVIIDDQLVTVKANIEGEYRPGSASQDIDLVCVSTGALERGLIEKITK